MSADATAGRLAPPRAAAAGRPRGHRVIAAITARRAARSALPWGVLFGLLVWNEAASYAATFPTAASRQLLVQTLGSNQGLIAVIGPGRALDTVNGVVAWRMYFLMVVVGAVWGMLTGTRLLRAEEDAGRWELLLAGRTTRSAATAQALAGLAAGFAVLWALTAAGTVTAGLRSDVGFSVPASLFYATAGTASAAVFLAVGALTSQLAPTRRAANGLATAVFAVAYLVRLVADSVDGLAWLRWASPIGWIEDLQPLTGSRFLALVPLVLLVAAAGGTAVLLAGRRDTGAGLLARRGAPAADLRLLDGPGSLVVRLERWTAVGWIAGLATLALLFGVVAQAAAKGEVGLEGIQRSLGRLGGPAAGDAAAAWIGYEFLYLAALVAYAAATQVAAMREEEATGHLDNVLARPIGRGHWAVGRLGFGAAVALLTALACGVGGWFGLALEHSAIGVGPMLQAGLNLVAPALFVLGLGTLLLGLVPRLAVPVLYAVVLWSFLVEIVGTSLTTNHWLLDTAVLSHIGPVPASGLRWSAIAWLIGLGAAAAAAGVAAFDRRDLAPA